MPSPTLAAPRRLGCSDLQVGPVAYGCWRFVGHDVAHARALVEAAADHGLTLVDTADVYGLDFGGGGFGAAESLLGRVLAEAPRLRDRLVLATKGGIRPGVPYDSSAAYLREACEASLRRLGVDVVDLYQVHRPDLLAHPAEVAAALTGLRDAGKAREVGVSNFSPSQVTALQAHLDFPLVTHQPELSAWHHDPIDDGVLDQCTTLDLTPLAWSPLAGGRLATGAGLDGPDGARLLDELDRLAAREGVDRPTVALAFVLALPARPIPIVGTQRVERIAAAARAPAVSLSRADVYALLGAAGHPLP